MGSGETTPGMLGVHRAIFATLDPDADCRVLDSPFAFQENADELVERINQYFTESLGHPLRRITLPADAEPLVQEVALADIRSADWLFAGPGSPSYARRCWQGTGVPDALAQALAPGSTGALVIASAAAVTLGTWALPVYEIYKVGEDPRWEPGIDLMSRVLGWRCALIPHYDNREGGTHDTRFCYVGGRRLGRIEGELSGGFILGVDEHTALVMDLDAGALTVSGRGGVTLRVAGVEEVLPAGTELPITELEQRVAALGAPAAVGLGTAGAVQRTGSGAAGPVGQPAASRARPAEAGADDPGTPTGAGADDPADLARAILAALPDSARSEREGVVALLQRADGAAAEHDRELAGRAVQAVVDIRSDRRRDGDWAASDALRDVLAGLGVEVRDSREGSSWQWA